MVQTWWSALAVCWCACFVDGVRSAPLADGAGGALHFNGRAIPNNNRVNVYSAVQPAGTFSRGISVSFWAKPNVPGTLMSAEQSLPGMGGGYFSLWPVLIDETPASPWMCASDYGVLMASPQTEGFQPTQSRAGALVRDKPTYMDLSEEELWVHVTISWDAVGNELVVWSDAGMPTEQTFNTSDASEYSEEGSAALRRAGAVSRAGESSIVLGMAYHNDYDLSAELDDWCVVKRGVSAAEAARIAAEGCFAALGGDPDLVMHYSFDDASAPLWDSVAGRVTGSVGSLVLPAHANSSGTVVDMFLGGKGGGFPRPVVSSAPLAAGRKRVVRDQSTAPVALPLSCSGCTSFRLVVRPARGKVCSGVDPADRYWSVANNGCPGGLYEVDTSVVLDRAAVSENAGGKMRLVKLFYVPDGALAAGDLDSVDELEFDVAFSSQQGQGNGNPTLSSSRLKVLVLTNTAPLAKNSSMTLREGNGRKLVLPSEPFMLSDREQSPNSLLVQVTRIELDKTSYPGGALDVSFHRNLSNATMNSGWDEWLEYDPAMRLDAGSLPLNLTSPARVLWLNHSGDVGGPAMLSVYWRAFDGLRWSNEARATVDMLMTNKCPEAFEISTELQEDGAVLVDLERALKDREGDATFVTIDKFPKQATVYEADPAHLHTFTGKERVLGGNLAVAEVQQWAVASPNNSASSVWDEAVNPVSNLIGEPDHFPAAGDSSRDWQPQTIAEHMWVQVAFTTPVFPTALALFETWSPGSAYLIEAADADQPGRWVELWRGDNRQASFCPTLPKTSFCAAIVQYSFCPRGVRTALVRMHFRVDGPERWLAVDAIRLSGTTQLPGNALLDGGKKLWVVPAQDVHGSDALGFSVFDCPYFDVFGTLHGPDSRHAALSIKVEPVDDPPQVRAWATPALLAPASTTTVHVELFDPDWINTGAQQQQPPPPPQQQQQQHSLVVSTLGNVASLITLTVYGIIVTTQSQTVPVELWQAQNPLAVATTPGIPLPIVLKAGRCTSLQDADIVFQVNMTQQDGQHAVQLFTVTVACSALPTVLRRVHSATLVPLGVTVCGLGVLLAALASAWLARRAATRTVKLMSGHANHVVTLGTVFVFASLPLMAVDGQFYPTCAELDKLTALANAKEGTKAAHCPADDPTPTIVCELKLALFSLGTVMVLATLTIKLERVNAVFNNKKMKKVVFTSDMLIKRALAIVSVVALALGFAFVQHPSRLVATVQNAVIDADAQQRVLHVIERCDADNQSIVNAGLGFFIGALVARAAYLAYLVRNVRVSEVNDTKEVALSIYNIVVLGMCGFLVSSVIQEPAPQYFATALPIFLLSSGVLLILFYPKIYKIGLFGAPVEVVPEFLDTGGKTSPSSSATSVNDDMSPPSTRWTGIARQPPSSSSMTMP